VVTLAYLRPQHDPYRFFFRPRAIFLVTALLFGPNSARAASLEGYWYGKGDQYVGVPALRKPTEWLRVTRSDGTYSIEFRQYNNCRVVFTQLETGIWTVSGDVVTEKTLTVNGLSVPDTPYYHDTYKVIELDDHKMRIIHEQTGLDWTLDRVTEDFTFPDCKNVI
jgi:hypothetical protein